VAEKRKIGKEENWETEDSERIDQGMARKNTRDTKTEQGRDGKDENSERRKLGNDEPDRPRHF